MAKVTFRDLSKKVPPLNLDINPDQIEWSYRLNTSVTPTYGGEVIQILSAHIEQINISGQIRKYSEAENVFRWFTNVIQNATQAGKFDSQKGVDFIYEARGWKIQIMPIELKPLVYGRDVVVPEWGVTAQVIDQTAINGEIKSTLIEKGTKSLRLTEGAGLDQLFTSTTGPIGFNPYDPFSSPLRQSANEEERKFLKNEKKKYEEKYLNGAKGFNVKPNDLADWFNNLIPSYLQGEFDDLIVDASKPTTRPDGPGSTQDGNNGNNGNGGNKPNQSQGSGNG